MTQFRAIFYIKFYYSTHLSKWKEEKLSVKMSILRKLYMIKHNLMYWWEIYVSVELQGQAHLTYNSRQWLCWYDRHYVFCPCRVISQVRSQLLALWLVLHVLFLPPSVEHSMSLWCWKTNQKLWLTTEYQFSVNYVRATGKVINIKVCIRTKCLIRLELISVSVAWSK